MKKTAFLLSFALPLTIFYSCHKTKDTFARDSGTVYLDIPAETYNYFVQDESANNIATLGRVLFYDRHLSINNSISCGSCHKQAYAFSDNTALSRGFENRFAGRNTPALQNLGISGKFFSGGRGNSALFWDGRERDLSKLVSRPISNHIEMGIDNLGSLEQKLAALPYYGELFEKAFGSEQITIEKISVSVAAFMESIRAENTRFDQYQQGYTPLNALELEGETLFNNKYNCRTCHNERIGGYVSGLFKSIGLEVQPVDKGVGAITKDPSDNGKFKVPNLRNVALTAPYMHDGRFKTLDDVLEHYSHGIQADANLDEQLKDSNGQPKHMNINTHEKQAIIAFLHTLTDIDMITNPAYSDPFKIK